MKLLQLRDNGSGIRREDLPILAERFTTSKISRFDDLQSLETYGFRGEALASISFVSQLSVVTKTKAETCAWKACYSDGALAPAKPGQTPDPKPTAGTDGTIITAENLFYNTPVRLAALRNKTDEYARLLDVMTKYAVHKPSVAFVCRKSGATQSDLSTPGGSQCSAKDNIRRLYGSTVATSLVQFTSKEDEETEGMVWRYDALCSNASFSSKTLKFVLFINGRLVDSLPIRRGIEAVYAPILAKGAHPFVYLSLNISPDCLDVNVHPTKREVRFLHEDEVIAQFTAKLAGTLVEQAQSRPFTVQSQSLVQSRLRLESDPMELDEAEDDDDSENETGNRKSSDSAKVQRSSQAAAKVYSQHKVRLSNKDRKLDSMLPPAPSTSDPAAPAISTVPTVVAVIPEAPCSYTSIQNLRQEVQDNVHRQLKDILVEHVFVGLVDASRGLSLIQHTKKLYLLNHSMLSEELFYQLLLRQFSSYSRIGLKPPASIRRLLRIGLEAEFKRRPEARKHDIDILEEKIATLLTSRRVLLDEHFSLRINDNGELETLPRLLPGYVPSMMKLPLLVMRLGPQVDWTHEERCFSSIMRELAVFYSLAPAPLAAGSDDQKDGDKELSWQVQHVVLAHAQTAAFEPPASLLDAAVVEVANLPQLYKVFERC
ncbi:DNA binding protein [Auriculariales sp. MPI-PUGE-AT-0066]|nr:DNA binding protein [Auriculariales sp. MPI-PUGE-AT-0066]